ncbi:hypothetical protein BD410DRAFT_780313 [Rickenella mellea]|uniref:DUF202 domain-containing protein n=1 Tax=Rickenella mellea TaxID=50990 RepID=A0A4R5XFC4_9AGAM|nr:hypothetical protein BD410DRAFT_780313 [Rickenella mellea]
MSSESYYSDSSSSLEFSDQSSCTKRKLPTYGTFEDLKNASLSSPLAGCSRDTSPIVRRGLKRIHEEPPLLFLGVLNPCLELENAGCVARDHLANERTFFSYVRTSLAIAATSTAFLQLFTLTSTGEEKSDPPAAFVRPLVATGLCIALLIQGIGVARFFEVQTSLLIGVFSPAQNELVFIACTLLAFLVVVFAILIAWLP